MPILFTILLVVLVGLIFLAAFMLIRTAMFPRLPAPTEALETEPVDPESIAQHLSQLIQIETISSADPKTVARAEFERLHRKLESFFPRVHKSLKLEKVNGYTLLYIWPGTNPDLPGALFTAHFDVVPADPATLDQWTYPPFSGVIVDGYVWGRGTLDIKSQGLAVLEAAERLLEADWQPERSIYFAFGHDEESGGHMGASAVVELMRERGVELEAMLDEGGAIMDGIVPGARGRVALVATAEKGMLNLHLAAKGDPGHSSTPPSHTAIGRLSRALARLEVNPLPARLDKVVPMFRSMAPFLSFGMQFVFANLWLLGGLVKQRLANNPTLNAAVRTTTALTIVKGGIKENVLPSVAEANVNFRILPGDTIASVCNYVREVIGDPQVEFEPVAGAAWEASPVSPTDSPAYQALDRVIRSVYPDVLTAPFLELGATDARYYAALTPNALRFSPYTMTAAALKSVHGIDERILVDDLGRMVQFFMLLMKEWAG